MKYQIVMIVYCVYLMRGEEEKTIITTISKKLNKLQ